MSQVWSEYNKIVNAAIPSTDCFGSNLTTDIINMENYKKLTFLVITGAAVNADGVITVSAGESASTACATEIAFKYRTMVNADVPNAASDLPSALLDGTSTGIIMEATKEGGMYIIEVDAATVCDATTGTTYYDHVSLTVTENTGTAQDACVLAVLSEPRYPQSILVTAID